VLEQGKSNSGGGKRTRLPPPAICLRRLITGGLETVNFRIEDLTVMPNKKVKKIAKILGVENVGAKSRDQLISEIKVKKKKK
jgi:hypothetical protein